MAPSCAPTGTGLASKDWLPPSAETVTLLRLSDSWMFYEAVERIERHVANAQKVAEWLEARDEVLGGGAAEVLEAAERPVDHVDVRFLRQQRRDKRQRIGPAGHEVDHAGGNTRLCEDFNEVHRG